ncbi:hypothetical protein H6F95_28170 [Cyanobacteria bacterium FACHB-471]|nr:hypothetical protein [Cyanobacteria bacterium FACHB-471]
MRSPLALSSAAPASGSPEPAFTTNYYEVTIQPEETVLTTGNRQCQLQAGMEAEANIIARQESFLQFALRKARLVTNL